MVAQVVAAVVEQHLEDGRSQTRTVLGPHEDRLAVRIDAVYGVQLVRLDDRHGALEELHVVACCDEHAAL